LPERRFPSWPLLLYGALAVVAVARGEERMRPSGPLGNSVRAAGPHEPAPQERRPQRRAGAPWRIPWQDWKDIFWRTYAKINDNRLLSVAAGAVFYELLALFPAIAAFVALYGLFANPSAIDAQVSALSGVLPGGALDLLHEELQRLAAHKGANGVGFFVGLLGALWSASSGTKAIIDALNVAYGETEKRSFIRLTLVALAYALIGMAALMVTVSAVVVAPIVFGKLGLGPIAGPLVAMARWPTLLVLVVVGLAVIYRYLPCRREPRWQWLTVGSAFAGVTWFVSSALFSWYIGNFGTYNATYGSLGTVVGMMMWMWISMVLILVGAQLNAEIEQQNAPDPAAEPR